MSLLALALPAALVAYIAGVFLASLGVVYRAAAARHAASAAFLVAWLAHLGAVVRQGWLVGGFPLTGLGEYLLLLGWLVMGGCLALWFGWRIDVVGLVLPPLAALAAFGAWPLLGPHGAASGAPPRLLLVHTTISTLGMATLCVALAMSAVYLFEDRALKARRGRGWLASLPPLERCDHIALRALHIGFLLLSVGIATGIVLNAELHERAWSASPKQVLPLVTWVVLAAILAARRSWGFRGRRSAYVVITAVMLGLLTVVGMAL